MDKIQNLSMELLREIESILDEWSPYISHQSIYNFNEWLVDENINNILKLMISIYLKSISLFIPNLLHTVGTNNNSGVLVSGLFCFFGQIILYMCQNKKLNKEVIDKCRDFTLLYLYVDYYLDTKEVDKCKLKKMKKMIFDPFNDNIPDMEDMVLAYRRILNNNSDDCKIKMIEVFLTEVEGMSYQKNPNLTSEHYLDIAERKGGTTSLAINSMFIPDTNKYSDVVYIIGSIIQLLDDMMDVSLDMKQDIHTIATHELSKYGNMDRLWCYTVLKINTITEPFIVFKFLMCEMLTYILGHRHEHFTYKLKRRFRNNIHITHPCIMSLMSKIILSTIKPTHL